MKQQLSTGLKRAKAFYQGFISGMWFVHIVRQLVVTGGNIAESAFLLATLWVIVNAVAHDLVTWILSSHDIELVNNLSTIAFGALPELILISVIGVSISHWRTAIKQRDKISGVWAVLYSIPTGFFVVITVTALTTFVSTKGTQYISMDPIWLVIRCLSGWLYAVVNMLFQQLGKPYHASQLAEKDSQINQLQTQIDRLNQDLQTRVSELSNELKARNEQVNLLTERASSVNREALENYPKVLNEWVEKNVKTASVEEIEAITGQSKRRINIAIKAGKLTKDNRNKDLIRVSSVIEWLKTAPLPETPIPSNGHSNGDTDPLELPVLTASL